MPRYNFRYQLHPWSMDRYISFHWTFIITTSHINQPTTSSLPTEAIPVNRMKHSTFTTKISLSPTFRHTTQCSTFPKKQVKQIHQNRKPNFFHTWLKYSHVTKNCTAKQIHPTHRTWYKKLSAWRNSYFPLLYPKTCWKPPKTLKWQKVIEYFEKNAFFQ